MLQCSKVTQQVWYIAARRDVPSLSSACDISKWAELKSTPPSFSLSPACDGSFWVFKSQYCWERLLMAIFRIFKVDDCICLFPKEPTKTIQTYVDLLNLQWNKCSSSMQVTHQNTVCAAAVRSGSNLNYIDYFDWLFYYKAINGLLIGQAWNFRLLSTSPLSSSSTSSMLQWHKSDSAQVGRWSHAHPEHCRLRDTVRTLCTHWGGTEGFCDARKIKSTKPRLVSALLCCHLHDLSSVRI